MSAPKPPPGPYFWRYRGHNVTRYYLFGVPKYEVWRPVPGVCGMEFDSFVPSLAAGLERFDALIRATELRASQIESVV